MIRGVRERREMVAETHDLILRSREAASRRMNWDRRAKTASPRQQAQDSKPKTASPDIDAVPHIWPDRPALALVRAMRDVV
jgi:hypothetical protein